VPKTLKYRYPSSDISCTFQSWSLYFFSMSPKYSGRALFRPMLSNQGNQGKILVSSMSAILQNDVILLGMCLYLPVPLKAVRETGFYYGHWYFFDFLGVPNLSTNIFLSFCKWTRIGYINRPGLALKPFPSSVGWDKIRTRDLSIVNLVAIH